jgi:hypothetical protein
LSKAPTNPIPSNARLNNSIVDGLQSEALNSLDATYVFVRQTKSAIDGLLFDNKNATKTSFYAEGILIMAQDIRIRMLCKPNTDSFGPKECRWNSALTKSPVR